MLQCNNTTKHWHTEGGQRHSHTWDGSEKKFFLSLSVKERLKSEMYTVTPSTSGSSTVTISTESLNRNPEAVNSPIFVDAPMHKGKLEWQSDFSH